MKQQQYSPAFVSTISQRKKVMVELRAKTAMLQQKFVFLIMLIVNLDTHTP